MRRHHRNEEIRSAAAVQHRQPENSTLLPSREVSRYIGRSRRSQEVFPQEVIEAAERYIQSKGRSL